MINTPPNQVVLQEKTRRELLRKSDLVPPLSEIVVRLLAALNRPDTEPADLEQLLANDQVLVARMLTMVNSPFFGSARPVRSVRDAVMVLGFRGVRALVLATATTRFMQRDFVCYGHSPRGLWTHAVCVGAGSRALAQTCGVDPEHVESVFIAGLLHDIGKLLLVQYLPEENAATAPQPACEFERVRVGIDHAEAGALVAAKWNLPPEVQDVIAAHHDTTGTGSRLAAIVRIADAIAHGHGAGWLPGRAPLADVLPADLAALRVDREWATLRDDVVQRMDEAVRALASVAG